MFSMPVASLFPLGLSGFAAPKVCFNDPHCIVEGFHKRIGYDCDALFPSRGVARKVRKELKHFCHKWCATHFEPLEHILSFEDWLETTNYSQAEKERLRLVKAQVVDEWAELSKAKVKSFVKDESYTDIKYARMINAREDVAKVILGPIVKSMEKYVYTTYPEFFVKGLTWQQRVDKVKRFEKYEHVYVSDYSSFECHFTPEVMDAVEFECYRILLKNFPEQLHLLDVFKGKNIIENKYVKATVHGVRMSGEMNTSFGNCISNLLFMHFVASRNSMSVVDAIVEGDDGLFVFSGRPEKRMFSDIGLNFKLEEAKPWLASFCGCVYNPETRQLHAHPIDALSKLSWSKHTDIYMSDSHRRTLMYSKCLSYLQNFTNVPIVGPYCHAVCCALRKYVVFDEFVKDHIRKELRWTGVPMDQFISMKYPRPIVTDSERSFFEEITGIPADTQRRIEHELLASLTHSVATGMALPVTSDTLVEEVSRVCPLYTGVWDRYVHERSSMFD